MTPAGPLVGTRVIEFSGIGPGPFAAMMLADMGAEVLRIDRPDGKRPGFTRGRHDVLARGRCSASVDLKLPEGREVALRLVDRADALIEGFRPGVMERLGLGPERCLERNPRLVYGRMTGWGQAGPYSHTSGHDINYLALSGTLSLFGRAGEPPVPPANLLADFGGGGMLLTVGILAALVERARSGTGQVVDAAMVDGAALLAAMTWGSHTAGSWGPRGTNLFDTGAWYYEVYETADGGYVSFGSLEPEFFAEMLRRTGLSSDVDGRGPVATPGDRKSWPQGKERMAALVRTKTRAEWCALLEGTDACFAPVLGLDEVATHPHNAARQTFVEVDGVLQPAPAPRFTRTPSSITGPGAAPGETTIEALGEWGFDKEELEELSRVGAIRQRGALG